MVINDAINVLLDEVLPTCSNKVGMAIKTLHEYIRAQQAAEKNDPLTHDELRDTDHVHASGVCYCKECKNWHERTGFCEKNSYFVDAAGDCCDPADSPNWTMFDADDFCSKGERRK